LLTQSIYVFDCLQGLSTIPDASHAAANTTTTTAVTTTHGKPTAGEPQSPPDSPSAFDMDDATTMNPANVLCVDSDGGILTGSVGSLNKFIVAHPPKPVPQTASSSSSNKNRKQSSSSSSSSASSSSSTSSTDLDHAQEYIDFEEIADQADSILLSFKCPLSDEREVEWRTLLVNGVLYVDIPTSVLPEGSRDSFVSLLEFAEDKLDCDKVFVCFKRNRPDRNALMRVFMFLGFTVVPPDYKLCPQNDDIMSMVYNIQ